MERILFFKHILTNISELVMDINMGKLISTGSFPEIQSLVGPRGFMFGSKVLELNTEGDVGLKSGR